MKRRILERWEEKLPEEIAREGLDYKNIVFIEETDDRLFILFKNGKRVAVKKGGTGTAS